jgi:hypothetical protein|tara:strand:+ start:1176 stop:1685 length:510 start_codon:yes stop_codon:yes gene_type:complete
LSGSSSSLLKLVESFLEENLSLVVAEGQTTDALGGLVSTIGNVLDGESVFGSVPLVLGDSSGLVLLLTRCGESEAGLEALLGLGDSFGGLKTDLAGKCGGVVETGVGVLERGVTDLSGLGTWSLNLKSVVCLDDHPNDIIGNLYHFGSNYKRKLKMLLLREIILIKRLV